MLEKKPLKLQFIITFTLIIILSLISTMITYYCGYRIFRIIEYNKLYPANYFERQIPNIEDYIRKSGVNILNDRESLNNLVPSDGILYQVIDKSGNVIYGTNKEKIINSKEELYEKINTTIGINSGHAKIIPIFDSQDKIIGAISLMYTLKVHYLNGIDKIWIIPLFTIIILSPFIYIIIFTMLFSKKFTRSIGKPVNMLIEASEKVKEKDLDFEIDYEADNELGRLCSSFNEMKNELKESLISQWRIEQDRHDMVEALAHDLKTPFTIIQGYAESLIEDNYNDKEKNEKYLNVIKENAHKGSNLIKEMLYAAELESAGTDLHLTPVNIEPFLLRKKESYEIITKLKNIDFKVDIVNNNHGNKWVLVDDTKLERILDNIVLNSIRYTSERGTISIDAEISDKNVKFKICDTGIGFSSKDLSNVFNKFYRGDDSRSSKQGHSGLGLYITKKLVNMHGGSIRAYNLKSGGACIEFFINNIEQYNINN